MKIAVIAANGRSGVAFVEEALARGHSVRAGVHQRHSFTENPRLEIIPCDATNPEQVAQLIAGQDAVVSFIGHTKHSPQDVQTRAVQTIISCAQSLGVTRVVSLTGTGVRQPNDHIPFIDYILNIGISLADPARVKDGKEHAKLLEKSGLDWTILRVLKLQNTASGRYELLLHGPTKLFVSRQEVAHAAVDVLERSSFIRQMPILSRPTKEKGVSHGI